MRVLSDGTPWRPLVHARDIAAAFVACLEAPRDAVFDTAFNVGMPATNLQVSEIAEVAAAVVPGSDVVITGEAGNDPRSYRVDFARITERVPGFVPSWPVERGAQELFDAYRRFGLTEEVYRSRFIRLARLAVLQQDGVIGPDMRVLQPEAL